MPNVIKLYGIPNCSTVKKARDWLDSHHAVYDFHDFKKQGASTELLTSWLAQIPPEQLINRAGLTWRGLESSLKEGVVDNATALALMQAKTSLIKRPLLEKDSKIIALGFNETAYIKLLSCKE